MEVWGHIRKIFRFWKATRLWKRCCTKRCAAALGKLHLETHKEVHGSKMELFCKLSLSSHYLRVMRLYMHSFKVLKHIRAGWSISLVDLIACKRRGPTSLTFSASLLLYTLHNHIACHLQILNLKQFSSLCNLSTFPALLSSSFLHETCPRRHRAQIVSIHNAL